MEEKNSDSDDWYDKGLKLSRLGKYEEAIECFEKAFEIDPEYKDACVIKGIALDILEKGEDAITCYGKALELDSNDTNVWMSKGNTLAYLEISYR